MSDKPVTSNDILVTAPRVWSTDDIGADLAAALVAAQGEFGAVAKDTKNDFFKSKYADLAAVKEVAQPVLAAHGLAVVQEPGFKVIGDKVHDTLTTTVLHESGQAKSSTMILRPVKGDPQAQGSAITYAKRYAFMAVLGLVADDDDDGNAASGRAKPAASRAKKATPDDGVDANALAAAKDALKAAAQAAGASGKDVVSYFQSKYDENFLTTRSIPNLEAATAHYKSQVSSDA